MSRNTPAYRTTKSPGRWVHLPGDFILCRRDWHSPAATVSFPERQNGRIFLQTGSCGGFLHRSIAEPPGAQRKSPKRSETPWGATETTGVQRQIAAGASLRSADVDFSVKLGNFRQIETEKPRQWGGNSAVRDGRKNGNSAEKLKLYTNLHKNSLEILKKAGFPGLKGGFSGV